ncbi:MAG TPA: hypothetical protein VE758_06965 [Chthoniobacterales bacterium]|jgi:hypothetical protein|nr:hypothetical protein [Chthoniobacterales bacterium]
MSGTKRKQRPQPKDLKTHQRLATTARAVAQGVKRTLQRKHDSQKGKRAFVTEAQFKRILKDWPNPQKNIADQMVAKYGLPNEATTSKLFWYENKPWKRTELSRDAVLHHWPTVHTDFLTQTINYPVPPEMFDDVAQFDGSIICDRTRGEVSARCDSESANVLGMNLVHEIVTGKRTVDEARRISCENTVAYNLGRSAPYAERLLFDVPKGDTGDLDKSEISQSILRQAAGKIRDVVSGEEAEATDRLTYGRRRG